LDKKDDNGKKLLRQVVYMYMLEAKQRRQNKSVIAISCITTTFCKSRLAQSHIFFLQHSFNFALVWQVSMYVQQKITTDYKVTRNTVILLRQHCVG
jgi:hypothetical protein